MKFLSNLSVRNKLILLAILPFSVVLYFLQKTIAIQWTHQEINAQTEQDLEAIEKIDFIRTRGTDKTSPDQPTEVFA